MKVVPRQWPRNSGRQASWAIVGGASILAVLSASCCVLPIGLTLVGLGGSWLSFLGPFVAYREAILVLVGATLGWSWYTLWRSMRNGRRNAVTLTLTLVGTFTFAVAMSAPLWEVQFSRELWSYLVASQ